MRFQCFVKKQQVNFGVGKFKTKTSVGRHTLQRILPDISPVLAQWQSGDEAGANVMRELRKRCKLAYL